MQNAITRHPAGKSTDGFAWHIIQIQTFISIQIQMLNQFGGNPAGKSIASFACLTRSVIQTKVYL